MKETQMRNSTMLLPHIQKSITKRKEESRAQITHHSATTLATTWKGAAQVDLPKSTDFKNIEATTRHYS